MVQIDSKSLKSMIEKAIKICGSKSEVGRRLGSRSQKAPNFVVNYYLQKCEKEKMVDISPEKLSKLREIVERKE
ncbi:MAG: hypothetical protein QXL46_03270 [Nitrososphaerales archaeon]